MGHVETARPHAPRTRPHEAPIPDNPRAPRNNPDASDVPRPNCFATDNGIHLGEDFPNAVTRSETGLIASRTSIEQESSWDLPLTILIRVSIGMTAGGLEIRKRRRRQKKLDAIDFIFTSDFEDLNHEDHTRVLDFEQLLWERAGA